MHPGLGKPDLGSTFPRAIAPRKRGDRHHGRPLRLVARLSLARAHAADWRAQTANLDSRSRSARILASGTAASADHQRGLAAGGQLQPAAHARARATAGGSGGGGSPGELALQPEFSARATRSTSGAGIAPPAVRGGNRNRDAFDRDVVALTTLASVAKRYCPGGQFARQACASRARILRPPIASSVDQRSAFNAAPPRSSKSPSRKAWSRPSAPRSRRSRSRCARTSRRFAVLVGRAPEHFSAAAATSGHGCRACAPGLPPSCSTSVRISREAEATLRSHELQRRIGACRVLPDDLAHRPDRLPERRAREPVRARRVVLHHGGA